MDFCAIHKIKHLVIISTIVLIKQAVMANLGVSFVSLHTVGDEVASGKIAILDIQDTPIIRTWHVVALNKRNASQAAEAFRYFMLEKGGEVLNEKFAPALLNSGKQRLQH